MGPGKRKPEAAQQAWQLSDPRSLRSAPRLTYAIKSASSQELIKAAGAGLALFVAVAGLAVGAYFLRPQSETAQAASDSSSASAVVLASGPVIAAADPSHVDTVALVVSSEPTAEQAEQNQVKNELVPLARVVPSEFGDGMPSDVPYHAAMAERSLSDPAEFTSRALLSSRSGRQAQAAAPTPQPSPTPKPTPSREIRQYTVKAGDTLNSIADAFGITVATIMKANGIEDSEKIKEGDVLVILPISGVIYVVQDGDTVLSLADEFGVTPEDIIAANGLTNPDLLPNGMKLIIPEYVHRGDTEAATPDNKKHDPLKIHTYTVQDGDSVQGIADQFHIRVETLLWANSGLTTNSIIHPGDQLIVPPVDGVLHQVAADDTVFAIAARYGASALDIVEANGLQEPYLIVAGQVLIVPGGSPSGAPIQPAQAQPTPKPSGAAPAPTPTRPVPVSTQKPQPAATPKPAAPAPKPAAAPAQAAPAPAPKASGPANSSAANIALQYRGWRYIWGGSSPAAGGFDCSGLTFFAYRQAGKPIPRDLWGQMNSGARIARANLQYGDLVFFQNTYTPGLSHVGIYIGGGSFVHAASERTGVIVSSLGDPYWNGRYVGATRP